MIATIRRRLGLKLFLSYLAVILVGVGVIAFAARFSVPAAFNQHMRGFGAGPGMMQGAGPGNGMMANLYTSFQASFNEALLLALIAAGLVAVLVSLAFSRGLVAPLRRLTSASQLIASGHYAERVPSTGRDELGQLAISFNRMAEKLEQVEAMRRQLIGDVSHELRTPLTAIKGSMEGLIDGVLPATPETFQQLHQEAGRLERLVDDLQELSRIEAGAYTLELKPLELTGLVQATLKRLRPRALERRIDLKSDLPDPLPPVLADADRITQVLTNLVGNALQYTPDHGSVTVSAVPRGDELWVSVADTGIGIPAGHLPHLFTRFYRVDKSRSRRSGGGSGIGLTICKHLVEAHGGRIWAESAGEGQGSTFTFTLKIAD